MLNHCICDLSDRVGGVPGTNGSPALGIRTDVDMAGIPAAAEGGSNHSNKPIANASSTSEQDKAAPPTGGGVVPRAVDEQPNGGEAHPYLSSATPLWGPRGGGARGREGGGRWAGVFAYMCKKPM